MIRAQAARSSIEKGRPAATVRRRGETCSKDRGRRDRIIEPSQDRRKSFRTRSTGRRRGRRKEGGGGRRSNRPAAQRKASRIATDRQRSPGSRPDTATDRQERGDKSGADSLPSESGEGQVPAHADRPPNRPKRTDACGAPAPASAHRNPIRERAPDNRHGCTALSVKAKFVRRLPPLLPLAACFGSATAMTRASGTAGRTGLRRTGGIAERRSRSNRNRPANKTADKEKIQNTET